MMPTRPLSYIDSSALVKRYVRETGSGWVQQIFDTDAIAISVVSLPELVSALARRVRFGELTLVERENAIASFRIAAQRYIVIDCNASVAEQAGTLLLTLPDQLRLRTLDAIHVVSAQQAFNGARQRGITIGRFVAADRALLVAAAWAGLPTDNPEDHS